MIPLQEGRAFTLAEERPAQMVPVDAERPGIRADAADLLAPRPSFRCDCRSHFLFCNT